MTSNYRPISVQYAFRSVTVAGLVATLLSYMTLEADIWGGVATTLPVPTPRAGSGVV